MTTTAISIIGCGNVGSRIGEFFSKEFVVIFYDINENVIKELNKQGHICTTDLNYALDNTCITFVAVPTPLARNGLFDTSFLESVSKDIGGYLKISEDNKYHVFVVKSTVVPGTTENIIIPIIEKYSGKKEGKYWGIIYNPEFLTAIHNTWTDDKEFCISPSNEGRIVLGESSNKKAGDIVEGVYKKLNPNIPILRTDYKTAEMTKLVANARLALAISYSNQIFLLNKELKYKGIDIDTDFVINSLKMDSRIGQYGSVYGKAWGGPCFLKDTVALNQFIKNKTVNYPILISGLIDINDIMKNKYGIRE